VFKLLFFQDCSLIFGADGVTQLKIIGAYLILILT